MLEDAERKYELKLRRFCFLCEDAQTDTRVRFHVLIIAVCLMLQIIEKNDLSVMV